MGDFVGAPFVTAGAAGVPFGRLRDLSPRRPRSPDLDLPPREAVRDLLRVLFVELDRPRLRSPLRLRLGVLDGRWSVPKGLEPSDPFLRFPDEWESLLFGP